MQDEQSHVLVVRRSGRFELEPSIAFNTGF